MNRGNESTPETARERVKEKIEALARADLAENRVFSVKRFLPRAKRTLQVSEGPIRGAIETLLKERQLVRISRLIEDLVNDLVSENRLVEGRRVLPSLILKNANRRAVFEFIVAHPGTKVKQLRQALPMGVGTLYNHLRYLAEFDFVRVVEFGKRRHYFAAEFPQDQEVPVLLARKGHYAAVVTELDENGPMNLSALARALDKHHSSARFLVNYLEDAGVVEVHEGGQGLQIQLADPALVDHIRAAREELESAPDHKLYNRQGQ